MTALPGSGVARKARPGQIRICGDVGSCIVRREGDLHMIHDIRLHEINQVHWFLPSHRP